MASDLDIETISRPVAEALRRFEAELVKQLQTDVLVIQPILNYLGSSPGKGLRPLLFFLAQGLVKTPKPDSAPLAAMLELLHTATLIHDDVVDQSLQRRGRRSLNALWGDRVSVLIGDYLFAKVLALGVEAEWKDVLRIVSKTVSDMGRGELREELKDRNKLFTVEEYYAHIRDKTAGFFCAACEMGGLVVGAANSERDRLRRFGEKYGMIFQIRDDILDMTGHVDLLGKPIGQDVCNGRMTLPLILAMEGISKKEERSLRRRLGSAASKADSPWIRRFVEKRKGIEKAQQAALQLADEAIQILHMFKASEYRDALEDLVKHDVVRDR